MRFYRDIIDSVEGSADKSSYHKWTPESIEGYWQRCTGNPFIQKQFYPIAYWHDLLGWARKRMSGDVRVAVDIGCGVGNVMRCIRSQHPKARIIGIDLSEGSLEAVRSRFGKDGEMEFQVGCVQRIPLPTASADLITCTEVLEHTFPEVFESAFAEAGRVLAEGGYLLATVPFDESIVFVTCPGCRNIFTPYQHMLFEITHQDIEERLSRNGMRLIEFYTAIDRTEPRGLAKRYLKAAMVSCMPKLAKRLFPAAGVTGFLAKRLPRSNEA